MPDRSDAPGPRRDEAVAAYDRISDAVVAFDAEWRVEFCNDAAERLLDRPAAALRGRSAWDALPDAIGSAVRDEYERALATGDPVSFEAVCEPLDGVIEVRAHPSASGLTVTLLETERDTERVHRTEHLREREQALRDAYEVIADPDRPFEAKLESLLTVVRETIETEYATLSCVHEEADEYIFEAVDAPPDADLEAGDVTSLEATNCERAVETERTLVLEDVEEDAPELADREGNAEWGISCYLGTPVIVDGDVYGTFCFYDMEARTERFADWEVTFVELLGNWVGAELERQRYARDLEASNERLEQFADAVSHDLKEPLRMVSSYLELLEERYGNELDADGEEFLAFAVDGAERMRDMIDGLLEYSRVETRGEPFEPVDLDAVLADVRDDLAFKLEETDADLTVESLPRVEGDGDQLRQVFQNLLCNAIDYSGDDPPRIHVGAERCEARNASKRSGEAAEYEGAERTVSVSDEGVGIDPDDQERIFGVFQRLHSHEEREGTGIGLALCERIVERHGGEIRVDSEPGEGATFSVTLPAA